MKKTLVGLMLIASLVFSGCSLLGGQENTKPAAEEKQVEVVTPQVGTQTPPVVEVQTPSFNDGDLYLKALAEKNVELCKQVKNVDLEARCEKEVKENSQAK